MIQLEDDEDFLPDDAEGERSDDEYGNLSPAVRALMQKYGFFLLPSITHRMLMHCPHRLQSGSRPGTTEESEPVCTKIYYASRTH